MKKIYNRYDPQYRKIRRPKPQTTPEVEEWLANNKPSEAVNTGIFYNSFRRAYKSRLSSNKKDGQ